MLVERRANFAVRQVAIRHSCNGVASIAVVQVATCGVVSGGPFGSEATRSVREPEAGKQAQDGSEPLARTASAVSTAFSAAAGSVGSGVTGGS